MSGLGLNCSPCFLPVLTKKANEHIFQKAFF